MFKSLITIGSFQLRTLSIFQILAFFSAAFIFWKRGKQEHYSEAKIMDGFLLSFLVGGAGARIGFVLLNFDQFGYNIFNWFNLVQYPGSQLLLGLVASTIYLYFFARNNKWDAFEILDFWAQALSLAMIWLNLGYFFAGIRFGQATSLPWGIVFPSVFEKRHPIQLYYVLFHLIIYHWLWWLEFNYRTFQWYRGGKKTAQTGFLFIVFVISYSIFSLFMNLLGAPIIQVGQIALDTGIYIGLIVLGLWLMVRRSNRVLFSLKRGKLLAVKK